MYSCRYKIMFYLDTQYFKKWWLLLILQNKFAYYFILNEIRMALNNEIFCVRYMGSDKPYKIQTNKLTPI